MKLIVGLGNTGEEYQSNRHNVGFMVVDQLAAKKSYGQWEDVSKLRSKTLKVRNLILLAKPQTMMNSSGVVVKKLVDFYKVDTNNLYLVYDDLDLALGKYKIQKGKEPKGHKGIRSVDKAMGTKQYWHVRVGIENRNYESGIMNQGKCKISGEEYVLEDFKEDEVEIVEFLTAKIIKDLISRLTD